MKNRFKDTVLWSRRYISLTLIAVVAFAVMILFFNENSYSHSRQLQQQIDLLQEKIRQANDSMKYYHNLNNALDTDRETLERVVRENYHMQRQNEDVYIVD
jgi:cell division protein FtsB